MPIWGLVERQFLVIGGKKEFPPNSNLCILCLNPFSRLPILHERDEFVICLLLTPILLVGDRGEWWMGWNSRWCGGKRCDLHLFCHRLNRILHLHLLCRLDRNERGRCLWKRREKYVFDTNFPRMSELLKQLLSGCHIVSVLVVLDASFGRWKGVNFCIPFVYLGVKNKC